MTESSSNPRARRIRNALLASVFTLGLAGAGGALLTDNQVAVAQPVETPAIAPTDFTAVIETVKPAVVGVQVKNEAEQVANRDMPNFGRGMPDLENVPPELREFFRQFGGPRGFGNEDDNGMPQRPRRDGMSQGSGFFVSEDGYVVTNNHVVEDGDGIVVITDDGRELDAELIGTDDRTDLALLKVEGNDFTYVKLAQDAPKVGQWVIAIGNPFGLGGTVTAGIISADGRDIGAGPYDNFLQIDAPVNRGNSGGPTFNTRGEVIGVNTAIFSPSGGNVGIAFAIPAATVQEIVNDLKEDGEVTRGWLGVQIQPVTADIAESLGVDQTEGAIVADAQAGSPADKAGIEAGDIITKVNGTAVKGPKELSQTIAAFEPQEKITVTVVRGGDEQDIEVTLGDLKELDRTQQANAQPESTPDEAKPETLEGLGVAVEKNPDGDGVVVTEVDADSPAADKGLEKGDVIVSIGGKAVTDVADVESGIAAAKEQGRGAVLLKVQGENGARFVGVPFERG
jgi:serine protease Do